MAKGSAASHRQIAFDFAFGSQRVTRPGRPLSPRQRRTRLYMIGGVHLVWLGLVITRLFSLQIADVETWQDWALKEHFSQLKIASERGPILDRSGRLLAVSVPSGSVYVRPRQVKDPKEAARQVAHALDLPVKVVEARMREPKPFVWIDRQIPRSKAEQVEGLKLPGVGYVMESKRLYPFNQAASALIGKAGIDGNGLSGLERKFEEILHTESYEAPVTRDALGNIIDVSANPSFALPKGKSVQLTIDAAVQVIMDEELSAGKKAWNAASAFAVMLDSETGEVVGLSQAPAANFNREEKFDKRALRNLAAETVFEPGSIMKPLVAAAAIDSGALRPDELINCESGRYPFMGKVIKDVHPNAVISVSDIIIRSSNIGMTKIGARMGRENLYRALTSFGFGKMSGLGIPGESGGILRNVKGWAGVDVATHSFGQGVAVTPLQIARAMSAIANGGKLPTLRVVHSDEPFQSVRILSERSASVVREMMYGVIEDDHGTGKKAAIEGVRVGGKTGTAQKARVGGRGYDPGKYMTGFVGFVDGSPLGIKKTLTLMVVVDEPKGGVVYGGTVSAPIFKRIMQRTLHHLHTEEQLGGLDLRQKNFDAYAPSNPTLVGKPV